MAKIGFIGTGIMGLPMAKNLQSAGHHLYFSRLHKAVPEELIGKQGTVLDSPREVSKATDFIITMVPDTHHVEDVLFSETGVATGLSKGKTVIELSVGARTEWRKVVWPTKQERNQTTLIVVAVILLMALILWGIDSLLSWAASLIMG